MWPISLLRQEIERLARPGQRGASVTANRSVRREATGSGQAGYLVRVSDSGEEVRPTLYGRGRYGQTSYATGR